MTQQQPPHVKVLTEQGVLVLVILDKEMHTDTQCETIRNEFLEAVTQANAKKVVVDFRFVKFVASVAFRALLSLRRLLHDSSGRMVVCGLSEQVAEVFHAVRLINPKQPSAAPFEEKPDMAAAVAYLSVA